MLNKEHLNDEINLHNASIRHQKPHACDLELLKRRITPVRTIYENILTQNLEKSSQRKFLENYLNKFQFISLPSYDFRVKT